MWPGRCGPRTGSAISSASALLHRLGLSPDVLQYLLNGFPRPLLLLDAHGHILRTNGAWGDLIGPAIEDRSWEALVCLAPGPQQARLRELPRGDLFTVLECQLAGRTGLSWYRLERVPFPDAGTGLHLLLTTDIQTPKMVEQSLRETQAALAQAKARQNAFLSGVLHTVTEGRLILCETERDLPEPLGGPVERLEMTPDTLSASRVSLRARALAEGFSETRVDGLVLATGEAMMNALVHAVQGNAWLHAADGVVQVWVSDGGKGIALDVLPEATLKKGFSTAGTLGMGFACILAEIDRVHLLTGPGGTTVVLTQPRETPASEPDLDELLLRFGVTP